MFLFLVDPACINNDLTCRFGHYKPADWILCIVRVQSSVIVHHASAMNTWARNHNIIKLRSLPPCQRRNNPLALVEMKYGEHGSFSSARLSSNEPRCEHLVLVLVVVNHVVKVHLPPLHPQRSIQKLPGSFHGPVFLLPAVCRG